MEQTLFLNMRASVPGQPAAVAVPCSALQHATASAWVCHRPQAVRSTAQYAAPPAVLRAEPPVPPNGRPRSD